MDVNHGMIFELEKSEVLIISVFTTKCFIHIPMKNVGNGTRKASQECLLYIAMRKMDLKFGVL